MALTLLYVSLTGIICLALGYALAIRQISKQLREISQ